jgi:RND family efflux transporter MFP subunit
VVNLANERTRTLSGVTKAGIESNLSFKVPGTIETVNVKVGQKVSKGQLIASIDKSDYELQFEQSHAAEKSAKAQRSLAKSTYHRIEALYENGNVSLSEYEQAKTSYESAKETVEQLDKQSDQLRKQIGYTQLYAPMDGIIGQVMVERNENVGSGQTIVQFNSGSDLEVIVGLPESYISGIEVGENVEVTFPSLSGKTVRGIISEAAYTSGQQSSTYPVTIKILEKDKAFRPGMAADVTIHLHQQKLENAIFIPVVAVASEDAGTYVFVLEKQAGDTAIVKKHQIQTGRITDNGYEVVNGLEEGEFIVTAGISKLIDGMKVRMLDN